MEYKTYILKVFRGSPGEQYWEEFEFEYQPDANVISSLMLIQRNPVNRKGESVTPVVFETGCLEEVCGSCSMLINGKPRQACTALIDPIVQETGNTTITLAPFTKFPLVRDLIIDRGIMFENLKRVQGWIETDGPKDLGPGPKISQKTQEVMYSLSTCMTCGCCVESCPQSYQDSKFIGPQIFSAVRYFNSNPIGKYKSDERLRTLMEEGGISSCGNAQNCVKVCPKKVPLTDSIAAMNRDVFLQSIKDLFSFPERS